MTTKGQFITLEGIEGVGKSTHVPFIQNCLQDAGIAAHLTREPGGTEVAEATREVVLRDYEEEMLPETELILMFAGRMQHLKHVIEPALAQGEWIICDRFTDSGYAYQGGGRGLGLERVAALDTWCTAKRKPDLTLLFDAPVSVALERMRSRGAADRIEKEGEAFFEKIANTYLTLAEAEPRRYRVIDASVTVEEVQVQIKAVLDAFISENVVTNE